MITDMTVGSPSRVLIKFSLPMLLSVIFQQMYNIVDSIIAGNCVDSSALGAIGASYPVTMIFMAVATGGSAGTSVVVARLFGAKEYTKMKTAVNTALIVFSALSLLLTAVGCVICSPCLRLLGTPDDIFADSDIYLRIYVFGLFFLFLYNICNGIFAALGDSRTPLIFLMISSVGNVLLDLVFVICFKLGVAGVAWATLTAQGVSSLLAALALLRRLKKTRSEHEQTQKPGLLDRAALRQIARLSLPSILQNSFVSVGNLFIQGIINGYGSDAMGGYASAIKLNTFALTCFSTVSNSISNFAAQNMGAGKIDRVKKGVKSAMLMALITALPFMLLFLLLGEPLINLFSEKATEDILKTGSQFLLIVSPFYAVICLKICADGALRGCAVMKAFVLATCLDLILRVVFAYILSPVFGSTGIWMSWPVGWTIAMAVSMLFYRKYIVKEKAFRHR